MGRRHREEGAIDRRVAVLVVAAAALSPPSAAAAADALQEFQKAIRALEAREAAWWKAQPEAEEKVGEEFHKPLREQYLKKVTKPQADFAPVRRHYGEALAFEAERAKALEALAASGHAKTLATLWREALVAADLEAAAEKANALGDLPQVAFLMRQGPSIRLHGLEARREALRRAFAAAPGAAEFLGGAECAREAREKDAAARSVSRRVFLVDALAALPGGAGRPALLALLADAAPEVRIAVVEGLAAGEGGLPVEAIPLLGDRVPAVGFAALDALRAKPPAAPAWVEPLGRVYLEGSGRGRADALRALQAVAGRKTGDEPAEWKKWLEETRAARADGTWRRPAGPPEGAASAPAAAASVRFWGIPVESDRVLVAADGWSTLMVPADHALRATRHVTDWVTGQRGWRKESESVQDVIARLLPGFLGVLPEGSTFRILLNGNVSNKMGDVTWFPARAPAKADAAQVKAAAAFVADFHIGTTEFFQLGLQTVLDSRDGDTAVLVTGGYLRTDRFLLPEAMVAEFRRRNRFRRLRLHVVQVMDWGPECARVVEEVAAASGGEFFRSVGVPPR